MLQNEGRYVSERKFLVEDRIYPISRALLGDRLADQLKFPKSRKVRTLGILFQYRMGIMYKRLMGRALRRGSDIDTVFAASLYDSDGLTFQLPDHAHSERSSKW